MLHEAELHGMSCSVLICTVKALGDNQHEGKNYHISDLDVQVAVCIGSAAPSHFSISACIQAKDIPMILHHEFRVLEVLPEVTLVWRVPTGLSASDAAAVEYALHSHHSLLLEFKKKRRRLFCNHFVHIFNTFKPSTMT